jgi:hypothetical protein
MSTVSPSMIRHARCATITTDAQFEQIRIQSTMMRTMALTGVVRVPIAYHLVLTTDMLPNKTDILTNIQTQHTKLNTDFGTLSVVDANHNPTPGNPEISFIPTGTLSVSDSETGTPGHITTYEINSSSGLGLTTETVATEETLENAIINYMNLNTNAWNDHFGVNLFHVIVVKIATAGILGVSVVSAARAAIIDYRSLPGGSFTNYNSGTTLVHEVGHAFGLPHPFADANVGQLPADWLTAADFSAYTCPPDGSVFAVEKKFPANESDPAVQTCYYDSGANAAIRCFGNAHEEINNFMDYGYDTNLTAFNAAQVARMRTILETSTLDRADDTVAANVLAFAVEPAENTTHYNSELELLLTKVTADPITGITVTYNGSSFAVNTTDAFTGLIVDVSSALTPIPQTVSIEITTASQTQTISIQNVLVVSVSEDADSGNAPLTSGKVVSFGIATFDPLTTTQKNAISDAFDTIAQSDVFTIANAVVQSIGAGAPGQELARAGEALVYFTHFDFRRVTAVTVTFYDATTATKAIAQLNDANSDLITAFKNAGIEFAQIGLVTKGLLSFGAMTASGADEWRRILLLLSFVLGLVIVAMVVCGIRITRNE